jgi:hypothetical protein
MFQILVRVVGRYAPIVTLPVAVVLGFIGYTIESNFSSRHTIQQEKSINEERLERLLKENNDTHNDTTNNTDHGKFGKTIFNRNDPTALK